jgi:hypothetical protein
MIAWVLIVHIAAMNQGMIAIPGIASQQECERLIDVLIANFPHQFRPREALPGRLTIANDARCLSYEIAPNETQTHH